MEFDIKRLVRLIQQQASVHPGLCFIVAITGIPGSGKTTVAKSIVRELSRTANTKAGLISMDGFHLTREELSRLPNPEEAHARRGAPWTFDTNGLVAFVQKLRIWANEIPIGSANGISAQENMIKAPGFDHEAKDPVEDSVTITADTRIIIFEGNYLLLNEPGWLNLADLFDYRIFIDVDPLQVRDQLAKRHFAAGIEQTLTDAYKRIDNNDFLNAIIIQDKQLRPDLIIQKSEQKFHQS